MTKKWEKEKSYRLRKELFAFTDNKIAVQFWYEYQDSHDGMKWKRCYGLDDWTFHTDGKMRKRHMSGNDIEIKESGESNSSTFPHASPLTLYLERWFVDGVDVNDVDIGEAHW